MIHNSELVSVITPAYNCESTISETIESVLAQTWSNWEMLIVDDCSTDATNQMVKEYANVDERIKLIRLEKNSGSAVARNTAIRHAKGRYIALLDSDDLWKPQKLERQISFMQDHQYGFTFTAYDVFRDQTERKRKVFEVPPSIGYWKYLCNSIIGCLTVVVDKEQIPDFHMEAGYLEDILTWMYYLRCGFTAYGLNENLASYRVASHSKSGNKIKNAKRFFHCLKAQPDLTALQCIYCEIGYAFHASVKRLFGKTTIVHDQKSSEGIRR